MSRPSGMGTAHYLVFGDLHGRILPAWRLALAWSREHGVRLDGLLQVGDLGFFPDPTRLDKATTRHAAKDPLELGARDIVRRNRPADEVFDDPLAPGGLWFVPGNHEDYQSLTLRQLGEPGPAFPVDHYARHFCLKDGAVAELPGGLRVAGLWGVDGEGATARKRLPPEAYIKPQAARRLYPERFDVLLTHDAPADAVRPGYGSDAVRDLLRWSRPMFAFFGHYGGVGRRIDGYPGETRLYHLGGFELNGESGTAEPGAVGLLRREGSGGGFAYLDPAWLRTFSRHNWRVR